MNADSLDRRSFLKLGSVGIAAAAAGKPRQGGAAESAATEPADTVTRTLGRTGMKVSVVGLGTLRMSEPAVIQAALDRGINYIDTARSYMGGKVEEVVGEATKGRRDKLYIATKIKPKSKEQMFSDAEASLRALATDHVDVLFVHSLTSKEQVMNETSREVVAELRRQGKTRFVGVSTHKNEVAVIDAVLEDPDKLFDVVLVRYNFKERPEIKEAIARAAKAGIGIVAMKTQAKTGYDTKELGDISPHQAALKWVLNDPNVAVAVPGMVDLAQVKENTEVMGMKLSTVDRQILSRYGRAIEPYYCQACGACEATCPKGIDIAAVNRCLMYAEGYGDIELARTTYAELPRELSVAACTDCPECVAECRYGIEIGARIRDAKALFA